MKHLRVWGLLLAVLACTVAIAACGSDGDGGSTNAGSTATTDSGSGDPLSVALITGIAGISFYESMHCGAADAARELGNVDLSIQDPPRFSPVAQLPLVQGSVQRGIDAMVIVPTDPRAMVAPVRSVMDKGIDTIVVDATLEPPITPETIITDNVAGGRLAAQEMARAIGDRGKILIIGLNPAIAGNQQRVEGFQQEIEENHPDIELLRVQYNQTGDQNVAAQMVSAAVRANPDLRGVYTTNEPNGVGAGSALRSTGKDGEIRVVSYDASPEQVRGLKDGTYAALVVQKSYQLGYDGVTHAVQLARGEISESDLEKESLVSPVIATPDNVDDAEVKKYLYIQKCTRA